MSSIQMHKDFPKLFSEISINGDQRDLRWAAIENYASTYATARIEMLSRLAFRTRPPAGGLQQEDLTAALTAFHKAFSDVDPAFEPSERQDQILAVGTLLQYFGTSPIAAMAVTNTACAGARKAVLPIDLVAVAESEMSRLAATRRRRPNLGNVEIKAPNFTFEPHFAEGQQNSLAALRGAFDEFTAAVDEALADLAGKFNNSTKHVVDAVERADEELDMLSWVFGQRALLPDQPFTEVPADQKPLVFARDLASLTTIYPGPGAVPALMARAGIKSTGEIKIADAVNAVSDGWTDEALKYCKPSPATSPVHFALLKRQETGAGEDWHAGWAAITGLDAASAMLPIELAELFYREILWLR